MRLALIMPFLALTMSAPCFAQSDDFNPYQAVLDAMPLEQAMPLIEAAYGPVEDVTDTFQEGWGEKLLSSGSGSDRPSTFLFCADRLAAVSAPATPATAAEILAPLSVPDGPELVVNPSSQGVTISAEEPDIDVAYWGVGTKASHVTITYPWKVFLYMNFKKRCEELAAD